MWASQRILFAYARNTERLAGEPGEQYIMVRHVLCRIWNDVAHKRMRVAVVLNVGLFREPVPFAGKNAFTALSIEAHTDAANAGEQVNEAEAGAHFFCAGGGLLQQIAQHGFGHGLHEPEAFWRLGMCHILLSGNVCGH
ncbi:Protein of unknown function [Candidatus Hamiltonella defensa (Bemisia tabaci)]|nr:Protein of unknown function [Candidatus Hamiltonella defensa (Bemisia tabaci)]CED78868.1 Protein of unknown function [Candidatus Hamiltonella defensa (Bemisia tabaci)]